MTDRDSAGCVTADALHLAIALDSFTTRDWAETIGPAIEQGRHKLAELGRRRASLMVTRADGAVVDWVLEALHDRVNFLERLDRAMTGAQRSAEQSCSGQVSTWMSLRRPETVWESCSEVLEFYADGHWAA